MNAYNRDLISRFMAAAVLEIFQDRHTVPNDTQSKKIYSDLRRKVPRVIILLKKRKTSFRKEFFFLGCKKKGKIN